MGWQDYLVDEPLADSEFAILSGAEANAQRGKVRANEPWTVENGRLRISTIQERVQSDPGGILASQTATGEEKLAAAIMLSVRNPPSLAKQRVAYGIERTPIARSAWNAAKAEMTRRAWNKVRSNRADTGDYQELAARFWEMDEESKKGFFQQAGDAITMVPAYIAEIMLPAALAPKAMATAAAAGQGVAGRVGSAAAQGALTAVMNPQELVSQVAQRQAPEMAAPRVPGTDIASLDPLTGLPRVSVESSFESLPESLMKAAATTAAEYGSERLFASGRAGPLGVIGSGAIAEQFLPKALQGTITGKFLASLAEESLEERGAEAVGLLTGADEGGLIGGALRSVSPLYGPEQRGREQEALARQASVEAATLGAVSGLGHVQDIATAKMFRESPPGSLENIAAKEQPSRKDFTDAGLPAGSAEQRKQIREQVRKWLAKTAASQAPTVTPAELRAAVPPEGLAPRDVTKQLPPVEIMPEQAAGPEAPPPEPIPQPKRGFRKSEKVEYEPLTTVSGRQIVYPPHLPITSDRRANANIKGSDDWLVQEVINEAKHRNDDYVLTMFSGETTRPLPQASRDLANEYLFGNPEGVQLTPKVPAEPSPKRGFRKPKEVPSASEIRGPEEVISQEGQVPQVGQDVGREDLQRPEEAGRPAAAPQEEAGVQERVSEQTLDDYKTNLPGMSLMNLYKEQDRFEKRAERWDRIPEGKSQAETARAYSAEVQKAIDARTRKAADESVDPNVYRVLARTMPGTKGIDRKTVASVFPGAKISDTPGGWRVEVGDSYVDVVKQPSIELNWGAIEARLGSTVPAKMRDKIEAAGKFTMRQPDGATHSGLGLIYLSEKMATDATLRHEALHMARRAGIVTSEEFDALAAKYADPKAAPGLQEEQVAIARETWESDQTVWGKIKAWFNRLLSSLGITELDAKSVMQLMDEASFWQRPAIPRADASAFALAGRPDLANPATEPEARKLVDVVDVERTEAGEPQVRPDTEVQAEADRRLAAQYDIERTGLLNKGRTGQQLDDAETVMAKSIVNREAAEAMKSGDKNKIQQAMTLIDAYRRTGTEQARAFRQRRDPVESPAERYARMLTEAILTPPAKQKKALDKAHKEGNRKEVERIQKQWAEEFEALKAKLKALGVDLDNLNEHGYSKIRAAQALSTIKAAKSDAWDKAYEYWRNSILSSLTTQAANMIGNFGHASWHFTAERMTEALVNRVVGDKEGAQLGEFKYILGGILPGLSRGARNFVMAFKTELPYFDEQVGREGQFRVESPDVHIEGKKGKFVRISQRLLLAVDEFAKSLFAEMEIGARAYRIANAEGKTGDSLRQRIAELSQDIESQAWDAAYDSTLELTFQQRGGELAQAAKRGILKLRSDLPAIRYILPFITTPVNIFETGIKKSPLGTIALAKKMYDNYRAGDHVLKGATAQVAQQMLAWALFLALLGNDEEDPWITGTESQFERGTRDLARRTHPPQSVKVFGTWYSYSRIEPFATAVGLTVDFTNALKSGDPGRQVSSPFRTVVGQLKDKTFLSGIGDLLSAAEGENLEEKSGRWVSNFTVSWVPNLVRTVKRAFRTEIPERRVWGDGQEFWSLLGKRTLQKSELTTLSDLPIYDLWGRPVKTAESPVPATDWLYRMTVPAENRKEDIFVADRVLLNWNLQNPSDAKYPAGPSRSYQKDGERNTMTDQQFAEYAKLTGEVSRKKLEGEQFTVDAPTEKDIEKIEDAIASARDAVRLALIPKWETGNELKFSVEVLAGWDKISLLDEPLPETVHVKDKEQYGRNVGKYKRDFLGRTKDALQWLKDNGVTRGEAIAAHEAIIAGLTKPAQSRKRKQFFQRLKGFQ